MHGLGNDFVVLDGRAAPIALDAVKARAIADRRTGIGCDQIITLEPSAKADAFMRVHNSDGSESAACGNGARCVAALLMNEKESDNVLIDSAAGILRAGAVDGDATRVYVDMGEPRLDWAEIPLAEERDTLHVGLTRGPLSDPVVVNMGNPHAVFFVDDADAVELDRLGPELEHDPLFPERANIEVVTVKDRGHIRLRVWERGVGITRACGTGACAGAVAAHRRGLTGRQVAVLLDGGRLDITWREDGHVILSGPAATSFAGETDASLLA
jgi:diaminopimelate epimerase